MNKHAIVAAGFLSAVSFSVMAASQGSFNPDISLILDGRLGDFSNDSEYEIPGFMLGPEASKGEKGFRLGHNELVISSNIDDRFFGKFTSAVVEHEGETEIEIEEAYIEAVGLGSGITVKAGRFFSNIGYLNNKHAHTWDFADAPLVYRGLFGNKLIDDGLQLNWVAPTDLYFKLGAEFMRGERFPAGGAKNDGKGAATLFVKLGGDLNRSHSWQLGLSHWLADIEDRESGGHSDEGVAEVPSFSGDSDISGIDFIWKWAPNGNSREQNFKFQFEYFVRNELGDVELEGAPLLETTSYEGEQSGWYMQAIYQFKPKWRVGFRYDQLEADNTGSDITVLEEAGLDDEGHTPKRSTLMIDYSRSEFSRIRFQYSKDDSYEDSDELFFIQYIVTLGAHGAHKF